MTATSRPKLRVLVATLVMAPVLAACGVNFGAQTDQVYTPADGVTNRHGMVDVLNALIVSDSPGSGRLIAALANNNTSRDDELTGVSGAGNSQGLTVTLAGGDTTIPANGLVQLANDDAPFVQVEGDPEELYAGGWARVTFTFRNADAVTVDVPVLGPGETYGEVQLTPSPTSTPSASPSSSPSGSGAESSEPSASPTGQ